MNLTGERLQELHSALLSAYPSESKLKQMLRIKFEQNLASIASGNDLSDVIFELINWAESNGQLTELVDKAQQHNPGNAALNAFVQHLQTPPKPSSITPIDESLLHGHLFISYAATDGEALALKLYQALNDAEIPVWLDKKSHTDLSTLRKTTTDALKTCKGVLALLTPDGITLDSDTRPHWHAALRYKKPIIPIRLSDDIKKPSILCNRRVVELKGKFEKGWSYLKTRIDNLDKPEGRLYSLKERLCNLRLALANTDDPPTKALIEEEIAELKSDIKAQDKLVNKSKSKKSRKNKRHKSHKAKGGRRQQKKQKNIEAVNGPRIINSLAGSVPAHFQGREKETKHLNDFLAAPNQTLLLITGRGGMGKTVLVQRCLTNLSHTQPLALDSIIYHPIHRQQSLDATTLYTSLLPLLAKKTAERLQNYLKDSPQQIDTNFKALMREFPRYSTADPSQPLAPVVLMLDNFETLLDPKTGNPFDKNLAQALESILKTGEHRLKVIITTRIAPKHLALLPGGGRTLLRLDVGLPPPYMQAMFEYLDPEARIGLKTINGADLETLYTRTQGNPRALEALAALLHYDRTTTLKTVLANTQTLLPAEVLEHLIGETFDRLDLIAQRSMQVLAIYGTAVPPNAVDDVLQPYHPGLNTNAILRRLTNRQLVHFQDDCYSLHPADQAYALSRLPVGEPDHKKRIPKHTPPPFSRLSLYSLAATTLSKQRPAANTWHTLKDLAPLLTEFDLWLNGQNYEKAAAILTLIGQNYLHLWGHYSLIIELWDKLPPNPLKWHTKLERLNQLGDAYLWQGYAKTALTYYKEQQALISKVKMGGSAKQKRIDLKRQLRRLKDFEGACLNGLGLCYDRLGKTQKAIDYHQQALKITKEIGNQVGKASQLGNLANCYATLGQIDKAIEYHQQSLAIDQEIGNRQGIAISLGNLGTQYATLGQIDKAIEYHQQSLAIDQEVGNRQGEASQLGNLGSQYATLGQIDNAIEYHQKSLTIEQEIGNRQGEASQLDNLGLRHAQLGQIDKAIEYHQQSLAIEKEIGNRQGEAHSLANLGDVFVIQKDLNQAKDYYQKAITIGQDIGTPDVQNYAGRGLGTAFLYEGRLEEARRAVKKAREYKAPEYDHQLFVLWGVITLQLMEIDRASLAFSQTLAETERLLGYEANNFQVLYSQGLALCGLVVCRGVGDIGDEAEVLLDTLTSGWGSQDTATLIKAAVASFKRAMQVVKALGYHKKVKALFEVLAQADEEELLATVRQTLNIYH